MTNSRRLRALPVALMLSLGACATGPSSPPVCPPVVEYDQDTLDRAADELEQARDAGMTALPLMIEDYGRERAMLRMCQ